MKLEKDSKIASARQRIEELESLAATWQKENVKSGFDTVIKAVLKPLRRKAVAARRNKRKTYGCLFVQEGIYDEYVTVTKDQVTEFMFGDGANKTIIIGDRSHKTDWTTYKSATFFIFIDFQNSSGSQVQKPSHKAREKGFNFNDDRLMHGAWRNEPNPDMCKQLVVPQNHVPSVVGTDALLYDIPFSSKVKKPQKNFDIKLHLQMRLL
ncbi:hypothetical protein CTI12_AA566270 [Artemisia annua]|uniref:Pectinesterase catalytic domain-containing protein n=1 Tax=Artemisia annua TaxID=35608 RepID=A0A2U1KTK6_ARTAN|nr:hypothetical protein CTI12_AA566270 [Artemisia annua]